MRCFATILFVVFTLLGVNAWGQAAPADAPPDGAAGTSSEPEVARYERELAARLVEASKAEQAEAAQLQQVQQLEAKLEEAKLGGDAAAVEAATQMLKTAQEMLTRLKANTRAAKELYDQTSAKLEIARQNAALESKKTTNGAGGKSATPFDGVLEKSDRVTQATEEAELAQKKTQNLQKQLQTLLKRQQEIRTAADRLAQQLTAPDINTEQRQQLWDERQQYAREDRRVSDEIHRLREDILVAEATQHIKEESAQAETLSFETWKYNLIQTVILFVAVLCALFAVRFFFVRRIRDPGRRYFFNKSLSVLTSLLLVGGLALIFAGQFDNLLTLLGLAVAGLTIALQEVVASFAAWFFIRSQRGYRNGDWVQIGEHFGEVIDIGFLRTTLKQYQHMANDGRPDGGLPTGGLVVLMNNAVFKSPLINYTREFPFVWVSLRYNVTFESNWERAREVIQEALEAEVEITDSARQAREHYENMAEKFVVKQDSLEPVVRTWTAGTGVELNARFLAHPRRRAHLIDKVNLQILREVTQSDDIRFAYWTVRSISTNKPPEQQSQRESEVLSRN